MFAKVFAGWVGWLSLATVCAVLGLLWANYRRSARGVWLTKPVASGGFLAVAWAAGAFSSGRYGVAVWVAMCLCWWGDVFLIPRHRKGIFLLGLVSFLLGHVGFVVAFVGRGVGWDGAWWVVLALVCVAALVLRWLWPHLEGKMRFAVPVYVLVISTMVASAVATHQFRSHWLLLIGALAFYFSDLAVARERFVKKTFLNRAWGIPLYYGAQILLAASVSLP